MNHVTHPLSLVVLQIKLSGQFQACLYFYEKILNSQKRKSKQNQPTKQKQTKKKQQRQQFFVHKSF